MLHQGIASPVFAEVIGGEPYAHQRGVSGGDDDRGEIWEGGSNECKARL